MKIGIINIGVSNINSIIKSLKLLEDDLSEISQPEHFQGAFDKIIFPGVGNFHYVMNKLLDLKLHEPIQKFCGSGGHFLGICLGMQLLLEVGFEGKETKGLGIIPGNVVKLSLDKEISKIPHNGWNEVSFQSDDPLFSGITDRSDFYFNHSFSVKTTAEHVLAVTPANGSIVSAIRWKNTWGVQFHPEKSQSKGQRVLHNFLTMGI
jgi:glutamine amidotransferase